MLGLPWLSKHDPTWKFGQGTFRFDSEYCRKHCSLSGVSSSVRVLPAEARPRDWGWKDLRPIELQRRDVAAIRADSIPRYVAQGCKVFTVTLEDLDRTLNPPTDADSLDLPPEIQEFAEFFSPNAAERLPPHRPYDHDIRLLPGKTLPFGPLYPMSREELRVLRDWLDENLAKGFIRPSSSHAASPVLFVKKPDGGLRFCVDYRALNNISEKDRYPLPLTKETLNNLSGMKWFSKVDIISAFNNL